MLQQQYIHRISRVVLLGVFIFGTGLSPLFAGTNDVIQFHITSQSQLKLTGNSTLHPYAFQSENVDGQLTVNANEFFHHPLKAVADNSGGKVVIPVGDLDSGEHGLNKNMQKTMKAGKFPEIVFVLDSLTRVTTTKQPEEWTKFQAYGHLTISGQTQHVQLPIEGKQIADEILQFKGEKTLLMTDFGVNPPTLMFGAIKTDNQIKVSFDITVESNRNLSMK